jgi:hypothetical protein
MAGSTLDGRQLTVNERRATAAVVAITIGAAMHETFHWTDSKQFGMSRCVFSDSSSLWIAFAVETRPSPEGE